MTGLKQIAVAIDLMAKIISDETAPAVARVAAADFILELSPPEAIAAYKASAA